MVIRPVGEEAGGEQRNDFLVQVCVRLLLQKGFTPFNY